MTAPSNFVLSPKIFRGPTPDIHVSFCDELQIAEHLPEFFKTANEGVIGLAPLFLGQKCGLSKLAISSRTCVLIVTPSRKVKTPGGVSPSDPPEASLRALLCHSSLLKCAFHMDRLAASLFLDYGFRITSAKDLMSLSRGSRQSLASFVTVMGGEINVNRWAVKELHRNENISNVSYETLALQAFAAFSSAVVLSNSIQLEIMPSIDTQTMDKKILKLISSTILTGTRQLFSKPMRQRNEVIAEPTVVPGRVNVQSQRYKTRVTRTNGGQHLVIDAVAVDGEVTTFSGRAIDVNGRLATLSIGGDVSNSNIQSVETVGRDKQSAAESVRTTLMLSALQRTINLATYPFVSEIFLHTTAAWETAPPMFPWAEIYYPAKTALNESQSDAVEEILSDDDENRVVMIHGPPGSGKTTVIAASVTSIMAQSESEAGSPRTVWLVAQSNVAVKNMAEKLASVGFFDFKLLVAKDFHLDWHEHIYEKIAANVIRSDDFLADLVGTERQLLGSRVMLCTLSMLCNDILDTISQLVPLQTIIVDEASQIEVGEYLPLIIRFRPTLRKLIFVGDDKQLPPYSAMGDTRGVDSIFELKHLRKRAVFLDTQYRLPVPIGDFISKYVYDDKLMSDHCIKDPQCCTFIDVSDGTEEAQGRSWKNTREAAVAVSVAKQLADAGRSFRIITPYDAQRALLETSLKDAGLKWEDKCFNIDSFQGNEDDYVVISLVRSVKMGFLEDARRVNVMLTRCKKGMIICTSRNFLEGPAQDSLVGQLQASINSPWIDGRQVQLNGVPSFSL